MTRGVMQSESYEGLPPKSARLVLVAAVGAFLLLPANLWLAESWPYLVQLCLAWTISMALFIRFIYEVLSEKRESGGT